LRYASSVIRTLEIKNFRCARDVTLNLGPVTALVGANGSGKSTLLDAIALRVKSNPSDHWRHDPRAFWSVRGIRANGSGFTLGSNSGAGGERPNGALLRLDLNKLRAPVAVQNTPALAGDGSGLANLIATMPRKRQAELAKKFCTLVPLYADVDVVPAPGRQGENVLRFHDRWLPSVEYLADEVSDGSLLVLAFLAIEFQPQPIDLLAIEEPERGLHPFLMGEIVDVFRQLASGARPIQIVMATHSAELLEHLRPEEVRFLSRDPADGSTRVHEIDGSRPKWREAFREYNESLGSAWLSGTLGGVPG